MALNYKQHLLGELETVQEKCAQLEHLSKGVPPDFFENVRKTIETEAEKPSILKLPVLFFLLRDRDLSPLLAFDKTLGRIQRNTQRDFDKLMGRLQSLSDYRRATGALFELEILTRLLDARELASVIFYPTIPATGGRQEASFVLSRTQTRVSVEATILSQSRDQEEIQDIAGQSIYEQVILSEEKKEKLHISSVKRGTVTRTGDPYDGALRVISKLDGKRSQLHPQTPNIICLGLPDMALDVLSVEWASSNFFSGSLTMAEIVQARYKQLLENKRAMMPTEKIQEITEKIQKLSSIISGFQAEPRLSGVFAFRWNNTGFSPNKAFHNLSANSSNALTQSEWEEICRALGFKD